MFYHTIIASILLLSFGNIRVGFDDPALSLDKLPRTIKKQPSYVGKPGYVLLVFGDDLTQPRWLVVDGKTAYFDRNGNGDLTDQEDRIEADKEKSDQDESYFNLGEVAVGGVKHQKLAFTVTSPDQLTHLEDAPVVSGLALKAKVMKFWGEFEIPGFTGRCAYGRVPRMVGPFDKDGYLFLENDPKEARIVHFGNKWSIQLFGQQKLFQGTEKDIILNVGSRGWGSGTFAQLGYEKVISEDLYPHITLMFPKAGGSGPQKHEQTLKDRCCTYLLRGPVRIPADVPPGTVQVTIDFSSWPALANPKATGEISVRLLPVVPVEETVSPRLARTLQHPDRNSSFASIQFSKDGKRLLAGGYPEGNVVIYDVATGSRQTQIETGNSSRGSSNYAHVTPDERSMLVIKERYPKIEHFVKDNQPMVRFLPNTASIRRWNLETGELLWSDSRLDQCRIATFLLSPTGKVFVIEDEPACDLPRGNQPKRRGMYGETSNWKIHPLPAGLSGFGTFSQDGKYFATFEKAADNNPKSIKLLDGERFNELGSWPIQEPYSECFFKELTPDHHLIYQQMVMPRKDDWKNATRRMMRLDVSKADARPQVLISEMKQNDNTLITHDKSQLLHVTRVDAQFELKLIDLAMPSRVRTTPLPSEPDRYYGSSYALSHRGKYLALAQWAEIPKSLLSEDEIKPEQIGQPRIILIEVATGKVVDTLVSPHAFLGGFAFSPDDKTLATSGNGCIHLWDVSHLK